MNTTDEIDYEDNLYSERDPDEEIDNLDKESIQYDSDSDEEIDKKSITYESDSDEEIYDADEEINHYQKRMISHLISNKSIEEVIALLTYTSDKGYIFGYTEAYDASWKLAHIYEFVQNDLNLALKYYEKSKSNLYYKCNCSHANVAATGYLLEISDAFDRIKKKINNNQQVSLI